MSDRAITVDADARLAIVGNINLDIKTSLIPASPALFEDGETPVDEVYESIGGGGANVALAAARLGATVHFCGCIGSDALGERLAALLLSQGVSPHLRRKPGVTGRSINLAWNNHHRHFVSSLPNARLLTVRDVDLKELAAAGCRHLFRADVWFAQKMLEGGNQALFREAQRLGIQTSLDINWDPEWSCGPDSPKARQRKALLIEALPHVTWAHGNERELALFTSEDGARAACQFLIDHGCQGVIVHRGSLGAAYFSVAEGWVEIPTTPVKSAVCETGSGDVFSAAFLVHGSLPLRTRLEQCCAIAARHLQGPTDFIPRLKDEGFTSP